MAKLLLDRKSLLKKDVLEIVQVDLGNDEFVCVRSMTGHERDLFEQSLMKEKTDANGNLKGYDRSLEDFRAKLAVLTICDEAGELLLNPDDYTLLSRRMSIIKLEKIITAAQKLNKITEQDKEELVKNSEAAPDGSSNSGSVENLG
jgi:hypothetical protein